ncbi:MAG: hypothetical protein ACI4P4_13100 [Faecousia sp.]
METWKRISKKLLFPPVRLMLLLAFFSAAALAAVFVSGWDEMPVAYAVYVVAFYSLSILCAFCCAVLPQKFRRLRQKINDHPLGNRYMTDAAFKVRLSLFLSLGINLAYSAFKLVSGIYYRSLWIGAIAVYYILLSVIRFLLLYHMQRKKDAGLISEYRSYRVTAILMMCVNLTLSGIVLNMILSRKSPAVSDVFVITSAAYTFYILTVSIIDLIKYRKYKSPVMSAAKAVRFVQALVSLLSLEASMLTQFGDDESYRRLMLAFSGAGVCVIVIAMSVYMIVRANKEIKKVSEEIP